MTYKKPQDPLTNNGFGIYPLTTADQVILSDGSRLEKNGQISIGGGTVKTVSGVAPDSAGNVALMASDLGAATAGEVSQIKSDKLDKTATAADSSKLGGKTLAEIMLALYPVGSIYMSVNSTSPASLFGGTWKQIKGRFLIGTEKPENNDDGTSPGNYNYAAGSKGGAATVSLSVNQMPAHYHEETAWLDTDFVRPIASNTMDSDYTVSTSTTNGTYKVPKNAVPHDSVSSTNVGYPVITLETGSGAAHNNMPPYLAVYMWKRVR